MLQSFDRPQRPAYGDTSAGHRVGKSERTRREADTSRAGPVVFVTRKLPEAVEEHLARDDRARLDVDDHWPG
jgi:hypothetical protein